jgi:hypothetical protein
MMPDSKSAIPLTCEPTIEEGSFTSTPPGDDDTKFTTSYPENGYCSDASTKEKHHATGGSSTRRVNVLYENNVAEGNSFQFNGSANIEDILRMIATRCGQGPPDVKEGTNPTVRAGQSGINVVYRNNLAHDNAIQINGGVVNVAEPKPAPK